MTRYQACRFHAGKPLRFVGVCWLFSFLCSLALAAEPARKVFDLPAEVAEISLKKFSSQSGLEVVFASATVGKVRTNAVKGEYRAREALDKMVAGTGLIVEEEAKTGALMVARDPNVFGATPHSAGRPKKTEDLTAGAGLGDKTAARWSGATGVITGQVLNTGSGEYFENARVTVEGTALETFTNKTGTYYLANVPVGEATVRVFYTGMVEQAIPVGVAADQTARQDFNLVGVGNKALDKDGTYALSKMVVRSKEKDGAAVAINQQRFAPNIVNVIAADEFGPVVNGNIGELMKFLPGLTIDFVGGDARAVSINGTGASMTPVMVNGFNVASAPRGTGRDVELISVATNNISRVEVSHSPTPESPGGALAGSVNFVPQSAFDRARPLFTAQAYVLMRDNALSFDRVAGPGNSSISHINPGLDFSYIAPVNSRFGYTLTGSRSTQYQSSRSTTLTRTGAGFASNGTTLPDPTPDNPYLTGYNITDFPKQSTRSSLGMTMDYKLSQADQISLSMQAAYFEGLYKAHKLQVNIGRVLPGDFSPMFTHGAVGAGELQLQGEAHERHDNSYTPTLIYRHIGPLWRAEAGLGYSRSTYDDRSIGKDQYYQTLARRTGVTVSFDDNSALRPGTITVKDGTTGATVDPYNINSYAISTATGLILFNEAEQSSAYGNIRRDFFGRVPFSLKAGFDVRKQTTDTQRIQPPANFVGADGIASTTPTAAGSDDGAGGVLEDDFSRRIAPYLNVPIQAMSGEKLWDLYEAHPNYFKVDENSAYRNIVSNSKHAAEIIASAYLRGDLQLLGGRLKLVGGLRGEQTNVKADGPLTDLTRNYQRDANGNVIRGSNGVPLKITTDPLETSKLTFIERAQHAEKEYLRLFPSINGSYNIRPNLIARAAYYYSVGRPNFNQYAGGITLPDTESSPSSSNRITANNAGIKAWSAKSTKLSLEYYFKDVGVFSIGAYRRDFTNFFGTIITTATPQFLGLYGLDPDIYGDYLVSTQYNLPAPVRMQGVEFKYKQSLTFLPDWARGLQVFANASIQRATGEQASNFAGYIPRTVNAGISLSRRKFNLRTNWNYVSRARQAQFTGRGIEAGSYTYSVERLLIDVSGEYFITKKLSAYCNIGNLTDEPQDLERSGPNTPADSRFYFRDKFGSLWAFGVKYVF